MRFQHLKKISFYKKRTNHFSIKKLTSCAFSLMPLHFTFCDWKSVQSCSSIQNLKPTSQNKIVILSLFSILLSFSNRSKRHSVDHDDTFGRNCHHKWPFCYQNWVIMELQGFAIGFDKLVKIEILLAKLINCQNYNLFFFDLLQK